MKAATTSGGIGIGDGLLGIIALGTHLTKDYPGRNVPWRARNLQSRRRSPPSVKHFEARQGTVRHWIEAMAEKAFEIALAEGRLPRTVWRPANKAMVKDCIKTLRAGRYHGRAARDARPHSRRTASPNRPQH